METVITVKGMKCGGCANTVEESIKKISGVQSVSVNLESGHVTVQSNESIPQTAFEAAVSNAGFTFVKS